MLASLNFQQTGLNFQKLYLKKLLKIICFPFEALKLKNLSEIIKAKQDQLYQK